MKTYLYPFVLRLNQILFLAFVTLFFSTCGKKNTDYLSTHAFDNSSKVTTSIYGSVVNSNGNGVADALVTCSGYSTKTDGFGFFKFSNISTSNKATTVYVHAANYFMGSRTLTVRKNDCFKVDIELIPLGTAQSFSSDMDASLVFGNLTLNFQKNSIVTKSTEAPYSGIVQVFAHEINPTDSNINSMMPCALRGLTQNGSEERVLTSYGMFVAELKDASGNELQIKTGNDVTFRLKVPSSLMGNAPSEISLWHFDEGNVFWQEEGQATLINGSYEGNVSHFSFWNCDNPTPAIYLEMILHDQFNQPLSGMGLKAINTIDNSYTYGLSSASGWVGGLVPMNTNLTLEAYYSFYSFPCGPQSPVYSQTLSVGNGNINLGILTLNIPSTVTTVEGVTVDCSNSPVSNIALYMLNYNQMVYTNSNGQFKFILPCLGSGQVSLALIDLNNTSGSTPNALTATNYNIVSGVNNIGYYTLCDTMLRFMQYTIQDTTGITKTINNVIPSGGAVAQINYNTNTIDFSSGPTPVYFTSQDTTLGTHPITKAFFYLPPDPTTDPFETYFELNNALTNTITITQFPNGPGLIAGSFSINLKGQGTGFKYYATGTFRAYRSN